MRRFTGEIGAIHIAGKSFWGTSLGVWGILVFVFFDHQAAASFVATTQEKCKSFHVFKKVYVTPLAVDVPAREISRPRFSNVDNQVLNCDKLKADLFAD